MSSSASAHVVLVHGVPETAAIWKPLVTALGARGVDNVTTLSPPGFGSPLPADFGASRRDYLGWLVDAVERLAADGTPIDIVGHDWGAGHVFGLAAERPDLVRSWSADVAGLLHPDYQWHEAAKMWQQPDVGEEVIGALTGMSLDDRVATFVGLGLPEEMAGDMAPAIDDNMGRAILALYRSAVEPQLNALGDQLAASDHGPAAVITATDDAYVPAEMSGPVSERLGATEIVLEGQGHWWMVGAPELAADRLVEFWSDLAT